jgi:hypothetical protein
MTRCQLLLWLLMIPGLAESSPAVLDEKRANRPERGDRVRLTGPSGEVIQGRVEEISPDGSLLTLRKAERATLEARVRQTEEGSRLVVTLVGGEELVGRLSDVEEHRFALSVEQAEPSSGLRRRVSSRRWIRFAEVHAVHHSGKLELTDALSSYDSYRVSLSEARQPEVQDRDSNWNGILFGFLAGIGIAALGAQGCCGNPDYGPSTAFAITAPVLGGLGAALGYLVDKGSGDDFLLYPPDAPPGSTWNVRLDPTARGERPP